jgi:cardiolipin synthase A/B
MRQKHSSVRIYRPKQFAEQEHRREKGRSGWLGFGRKLFWLWWLWVAAAIIAEAADHKNAALVCAIVGFVLYLLAPGENIPRFGLDSKFPVRSHEFLTTMAGATGSPFVARNNVTILNNGDEFYDSMLDAIAHAQETITMENYIFWPGRIGQQFADAIAERCRSGVRVKLLLDAFGSLSIGKKISKMLTDSGCEVAWYNRIWPRTIGRFNHRNHRKSLIVDGRVAFTGGAGIADQWMGNGQDREHWHDIQIRVEGPGAAGLQTGFARNWLETTGELVSGTSFFPPPDPAGTVSTQTIFSSPKSGSSAVRIMYELTIISARKTLYIANPYFVPDDSLVEILVEARKRGVVVKIMIAGRYNDMKTSRYASIHLYGRLLEGGIEIYEYNRAMLHQKTMVADTAWATVGTTNFDSRSFALDEESNVCIHHRGIAERLEAIFNEDLKNCEQITLEKWRGRGIKTRVFGQVCVFLKEQI